MILSSFSRSAHGSAGNNPVHPVNPVQSIRFCSPFAIISAIRVTRQRTKTARKLLHSVLHGYGQTHNIWNQLSRRKTSRPEDLILGILPAFVLAWAFLPAFRALVISIGVAFLLFAIIYLIYRV